MEIRITTLSENSANIGYLAEWGLSLLIEVDGHNYLFDTGGGPSAAHNAGLLGIDLHRLEGIVLSHGHSDHTGGLRDVLRLSGPKEIMAHPAIWDRKLSLIKGERERYIGIPFRREELEGLGAHFNLNKEPVKLCAGLMTTGEVPLLTDFEKIDSGLFIKEASEMKPDTVPDDLGLVITAPFGLVVILGCAHRGVINTVRRAQELTGRRDVYAIIGGTHLFRAGEERIALTVAALREMGVKRLAVSHCTGFPASLQMALEFGEVFKLNNSGSSFTLP